MEGFPVTLNQLECFMVLAQRLNFTQAADDLFMAQPALSRLISALEKELDLQLFYRNSRSVALTPAGTVFFKKCPKILDEYRGMVFPFSSLSPSMSTVAARNKM